MLLAHSSLVEDHSSTCFLHNWDCRKSITLKQIDDTKVKGIKQIASALVCTIITKQTSFSLSVIKPHGYLSPCIPFKLHHRSMTMAESYLNRHTSIQIWGGQTGDNKNLTCCSCSGSLARRLALSNQGPSRNPSWHDKSMSSSFIRSRKCWLYMVTCFKLLSWYPSIIFKNTLFAYFANAWRVRSTRSYLE